MGEGFGCEGTFHADHILEHRMISRRNFDSLIVFYVDGERAETIAARADNLLYLSFLVGARCSFTVRSCVDCLACCRRDLPVSIAINKQMALLILV